MNADAIFGQARPLLQLLGSVLIVAGLLKLCGLNVPINVSWWELGLAGFLCKHV